MRVFDDPDDVFASLRMPGGHSELRDEARVVDLMANAHPSSSGDPMTTSTRFTSRRARVGALVAAGVIGFGGVAAAGPGGLDPLGLGDDTPTVTEDTIPEETVPEETVPEETVPEETVPEETIPDETVPDETVPDETAPDETVPDEIDAQRSAVVDGEEAESPEAPVFVDNPDTAFDESTCLPGNHGKTVSAVPRGEAPFEDVEVRDAAQSDCGKKSLEVDDDGDGEDDGDDAETEKPEPTESPVREAEAEQEKKNNGNGNGKKGGSGKGGGPGNSGGKGKSGR